MITIHASLQELQAVCEKIVEGLPHGGVVILQGTLAAGKTTLTQAFAKYLGLDDQVTSPTFSLQQCYAEKLFHYDIYNHGIEHFLSLGMFEALEREGYHFIEWGDDTLISLLKSAAIETMVIEIEKADTSQRVYRIKDA